MTVPYLVQHPPRRSQYRNPRRQRPSGVTVLHTAENITDLVGPDTGAEAVAEFIRKRSTPGSYHDLVDRDSALQLVPYEAEAYQDGTGSNPHALAISWAISCKDWPRMSEAQVRALLEQGAVAFVRQQAWLARHGYPQTPLVRISRADSAAGRPGFVTHGDRDPDRRSDPGGRPDHFPWQLWLEACRSALHGPGKPPTPSDDERTNPVGIILVQQPDDVRVWACDPASRTRWWVRTMDLRDALREAGAPFLNGNAVHQLKRRQALLDVCTELPA